MEPSCVRQDLIPGTSRLFSDYLYDFQRVSCFYPAGEPAVEQVVELARNLEFPAQRRSDIVAALALQNENAAALHKLSQPGTAAVLSGQQVGLFSGPAYTIFKALTAVKLAEAFEEQGIPAVPIFWLATEDHDLAEVDHAWVFDEKGKPARLSASSLVATGGPVGVTPLTDLPLNELRNALGDLPFADEVMAQVGAAYHNGATLGGAFSAFLKDLLSGFGLLFLDPLHPAIRKLSAPFLLNAAQEAPALVEALVDRSAELEKNGYHAQVLVEKDAALLFLLSGHKRLSLRIKEGKFVSREGEFTAQDLPALAERLSPNALLRPVLQDYLLPTAAYVGGPAEIAYFAQGSVLYDALLGRMPVIYPRNSFTIFDQRAEKLMTRYHLRLPDVLDYQERVKSKIAARMVPKDLTLEFDQLQKTISNSFTKLKTDLHAFDPTLQSAAEKSSAKILYQLEKLQRKTAREALRRDEKASADTEYLMNLVFPHKHQQERLYSILPFLAKYGLDFPRTIYAQTQLSCPDHMLRTY
jgi:bacillithiol biosynthesis cysteine-adding enzyme BshC